MILRQMPPTGALHRALRRDKGLPGEAYELGDELLAAVINILQSMSWQLGMNDKAPKPEPFLLPGFERPGEGRNLGDVMSIEEMDRRIAEKYRAATTE